VTLIQKTVRALLISLVVTICATPALADGVIDQPPTAPDDGGVIDQPPAAGLSDILSALASGVLGALP